MARILVVDDDPDNRETLAEGLTPKGHAVSTAANGLAGLHRLTEESIDLVLLDLMMPVMSGMEVLAEMRRLAPLANIPVIVMSASPGALKVEDDGRIVAVLEKPLSIERLFAEIDRALGLVRRG